MSYAGINSEDGSQSLSLSIPPLKPGFIDPNKWRDKKAQQKLSKQEWKKTRVRILTRDDYTCVYCGYRAEKYQEVHHIDGNHDNNHEENLLTVCPLCHAVFHVGFHAIIREDMLLFDYSPVDQSMINKVTRLGRQANVSDLEIINILELSGLIIRIEQLRRDQLWHLYAFNLQEDNANTLIRQIAS